MFQCGERLSRAAICDRLGIARDDHAVIVHRGAVLAVVVNESGKNPFNHKQYANALESQKFTMTGENDDRGGLLERAKDSVPLFFRKNSESDYTYQGRVRFENSLDASLEPVRVFERVEPCSGSAQSGR